MIDFIKADITNAVSWNKLFTNPLLDFKIKVGEKTGEISNVRTASYKGLTFFLYDSGRIRMQGSLHKYKNDGDHNFDDFTLSDLQFIISNIRRTFGIEPNNTELHNLEIGVNVTPCCPTTEILDSLLLYGVTEFYHRGYRNGYYKKVELQRQEIKLYDKFRQYERKYLLENDVFRFEISWKKMREIHRFKTLADLTLASNMNYGKQLLLSAWNKILLYDPTIKEEVKEKHNELYKWRIPKYWQDLDRKNRYSEIKRYKKIVDEYSDNIHQQMQNILSKKYEDLMQNRRQINHSNTMLKSHSIWKKERKETEALMRK